VKSLSVSQQSSASRRALLLGLTLAEIMLILLFALLLLLAALRDENTALEEQADWGTLVQRSLTEMGITELSPEIQEAFESLVEETAQQQQSEETISDTWTRISEQLAAASDSSVENLAERVVAQEKAIQELQSDLADAQTRIENSQESAEALRGEIDRMKGGDTPLCLYKAPDSGSGRLRGQSVPLGVLNIENGKLTFLDIYDDLLQLPLIDFFGQPTSTANLQAQLQQIPIGQELTIEEFAEYSQPIKNIADLDTGAHRRCMFSMDFVMEDGVVDLDMFRVTFQKYYLPQNRIYANAQ
jgi:hypothetical protein